MEENPYRELKPLDIKEPDDYKNLDECPSVTEEKFFYHDRIRTYQTVDDIITGTDENTVCSLEVLPCKKLISSSSGYAIVFSLYSNRITPDENISIIVKVTDENQFENVREGKNNMIVKDIVLNGKSPHFVLASDYKVCKDKCSFLSEKHNYGHLYTDWRKVKKGSCLLSFQEMFDGNVKHKVLEWTRNGNDDLLMSLIVQVMMACMTLYHHKIIHGDLHLGNIFYKVMSDEEEGKYYFEYNYEGNTYFIKHHNILFVLGDYGHMTRDTSFNSLQSLTFDLSGFFEKLRENTYASSSNDRKYKDSFTLLERLFKGYKDKKTVSDIFNDVKQILGERLFFKNVDKEEISASFVS
jgi:hypothetical protein